jgi:hypothetical protein
MMGRKADSFYDELLDRQLCEALNNDFGRAVLRMPNQGMGEVREEVFVYFSAMAMQQINVLAAKHGIVDPTALNELYQLTRTNLVHGFRLGQHMGNFWKAS